LAQVLLQPLAEMESLREHLPQGKMEEIVLFVYDQMSVKHNRYAFPFYGCQCLPFNQTKFISFSESQHQGYRRWRDSWGVLSPQSSDVDAFSSAEQEAEFTDYLKVCLISSFSISQDFNNVVQSWMGSLHDAKRKELEGDSGYLLQGQNWGSCG